MRFLSFFLSCFLFTSIYGQTLEIHQMSVGAGDAAFIVVRDIDLVKQNLTKFGLMPNTAIKDYKLLEYIMSNKLELFAFSGNTVKKAILIDGGIGESQAIRIEKYMVKIGVKKDGIDYAIISHLDKDHYGGILALMKKRDIYPKKLIMRDELLYTPTGKTKPINLMPSLKGEKGKSQPDKARNIRQIRALMNKKYGSGSIEDADFNSTNLELKANTNPNNKIVLTCIAEKLRILGDNPATINKELYENTDIIVPTNDENNTSFAWLLQYGSFRFFTGGDLNGSNEGAFIDSEGPLGERLHQNDGASFKNSLTTMDLPKGHICAFKVNHHGSSNSTNPAFLNYTTPTTAFVSCGAIHKHPKPDVILDLDALLQPNWTIDGTQSPNTIRNYYLTVLQDFSEITWKDDPHNNIYNNIYKKIDTNESKGTVAGDIVLVVDDTNILTQSSYYIFWSAKKPNKNIIDPAKLVNPKTNGTSNTNIFINCHTTTTLQYISNQ